MQLTVGWEEGRKRGRGRRGEREVRMRGGRGRRGGGRKEGGRKEKEKGGGIEKLNVLLVHADIAIATPNHHRFIKLPDCSSHRYAETGSCMG